MSKEARQVTNITQLRAAVIQNKPVENGLNYSTFEGESEHLPAKSVSDSPFVTKTIKQLLSIIKNRRNDGLVKKRPHPDVDGGWGWVVFVGVFLTSFILGGLTYTTGMYYVCMLDHFAKSNSYTAWIGSCTLAFFHLGGPVSSRFIEKFGCRSGMFLGSALMTAGYITSAFATVFEMVLVAYGIIVAVGMNIVYCSSIIVLGQYFQERHALATSLALSGYGVGLFSMCHILELIIRTEGWQISFVLCAAVALQLMVVGSVFFPLPFDSGQQKRGEAETEKAQSTTSLLRDPRLWLICMSVQLLFSATLAVFVVYVDYLRNAGHEEYSSYALSVVGVGDIGGRLATGLITSFPAVNRTLLFTGSMVGMSLVIALHLISASAATSSWLLPLLSCSFGALYGMHNVMLAVLPFAVFGSEKLGEVFGYQTFFIGVSALICPSLAGLVHDMTGSYTLALVLGATACSLAALLMGAVFYLSRGQTST